MRPGIPPLRWTGFSWAAAAAVEVVDTIDGVGVDPVGLISLRVLFS